MGSVPRIWRRVLAALAVLVMTSLVVVPMSSAGGNHHMQRMLLLGTNPSDDAPLAAIAHGPIHALGSDYTVNDNLDKIVFPKGTIWVEHHSTSQSDASDPKACYFAYWEKGTYTISKGTGAYKHVHGYGHYSLKAQGVSCDENSDPDPFVVQVRIAGPLWK